MLLNKTNSDMHITSLDVINSINMYKFKCIESTTRRS